MIISRLGTDDERIRKLKNRLMKKPPKLKCKQEKKTEQNIQEFWDNFKMSVLCITGLSQEKESENGEEIFRVIMAENITELMTPNHRLKKLKEHQQDQY